MKPLLLALSATVSLPLCGAANEPLLNLFQERCASCHDNDEEPELSRATNLSSLRAETKYIKAGDAASSPLYKLLLLADDDKKRMPKTTAKKPRPRLSETELALVKTWIEGIPVKPAALGSSDTASAAIKPEAHPPTAPSAATLPPASSSSSTNLAPDVVAAIVTNVATTLMTSSGKPIPPRAEAPLAVAPSAPASSEPAPVAPAQRSFLDHKAVAALVLSDLRKQLDSQPGPVPLRYLSLANLANERDEAERPLRSDDDLEIYRVAVSKLLNSLSWQPEIVQPTAIDIDRLILRINLNDYGIHPQVWKRAAGASPHQVDVEGSPLLEAEKALDAPPLLRADYFVFALSQPPLYHEALRLPGGERRKDADLELEEKLGIRHDQVVQAADAVRAGFQKSRVSNGNRVIERLPLPKGGYYWKSYDFDVQRQLERGADLFKAPLGPAKAYLTQNPDLKFAHDGGELIFSLPNGLQAYLLVDKKGTRLEEAPFNVVTDLSRKDGRIINGISCITCHKDGMFSNNVKDEVAAAVTGLHPADQATVQRLYNQQRLEEWFARDTKSFNEAQAKCGWHEDMPEPISTLYAAYLSSQTTGKLAAEIGAMPEANALDVLASSGKPLVKALATKLRGNANVTRAEFNHVFQDVVSLLGIGRARFVDAIAFTEFGLRTPGLAQPQGVTVTPVQGKPLPISMPHLNDSAALPSSPPPPAVRTVTTGSGQSSVTKVRMTPLSTTASSASDDQSGAGRPSGTAALRVRPISTNSNQSSVTKVRFGVGGTSAPVPAPGPDSGAATSTPSPASSGPASFRVRPVPTTGSQSSITKVRFSAPSTDPAAVRITLQPGSGVLNAAGRDGALPAAPSVRVVPPGKTNPVKADSTPTTADPSIKQEGK
jgi:hypothetical protein